MSSRIAIAWRPSRANAERAAKRRAVIRPHFDLYAMLGLFFVLLFLMMTNIQPSHGRAAVDLPTFSLATPQPGANREDAIKVLVSRDGHVFYRNSEVSCDELPRSIWESIRGGAEIKVYLYADKRARAGDVNAVMDQIHRAGVRDVVILAYRPTPY